jgi:UDP-2,4-diacetamido-2,4,6-trideoxy-beta-L-altropyranose hydrolase
MNLKNNIKKIFVRFVDDIDKDDLFKWKNDLLTIENSFNSNEITYTEHETWFLNSLKNKNRHMFIALTESYEKIGQIRFDKINNLSEIDITIAPNQRGKGYGSFLINYICNFYLNNFDVNKIIAKIKNKNIGSIKAFTKADFKITHQYEEYLEMEYKQNEN